MLLGSLSLWMLAALGAGSATENPQCSADHTERSSRFIELPTYSDQILITSADEASPHWQQDVESDANIVTEREVLMVSEIDSGDIPSTIFEASAQLSNILTCEDYQALISVYQDEHLETENTNRILNRINDLARYLYESWDVAEGNTQLAQSLRCISRDSTSIEILFILAAYYIEADSVLNYSRVQDSSRIVAFRLAFICEYGHQAVERLD